MPDNSVEERLAQMLSFTERMLACADESDWDGLELLARERQQRLDGGFGPALDADQSERVTEAIAALLSLNSRLVDRVAKARSAVMGDLAGLRHGRDSRECYGTVQGLNG